ncbi:hypothetical protein BpHYR1_045047 [Brachionus plicatilis]|uniref:Uncharacterized protein n=1 Tax=Brachionus plicatilis TaxID=10195 RepID=A0A3M7QLJ9_BRAPC|nr:hypothetical protein BpHYR1_045047 [Brachionus plicatilis]
MPNCNFLLLTLNEFRSPLSRLCWKIDLPDDRDTSLAGCATFFSAFFIAGLTPAFAAGFDGFDSCSDSVSDSASLLESDELDDSSESSEVSVSDFFTSTSSSLCSCSDPFSESFSVSESDSDPLSSDSSDSVGSAPSVD